MKISYKENMECNVFQVAAETAAVYTLLCIS